MLARRCDSETKGLGQPRDVTLEPLYRITDQRYTVYWNVYSPAEWTKRNTDLAATDARRKEFERRTIDSVVVDQAENEKAHALQSENASDGYFEGETHARSATAAGSAIRSRSRRIGR